MKIYRILLPCNNATLHTVGRWIIEISLKKMVLDQGYIQSYTFNDVFQDLNVFSFLVALELGKRNFDQRN